VVRRLQTCPPVVREPVLVQLRIRAGLTQSQVAPELEVSFGLVSHWERGLAIPGWPQVRHLALLYGASLDCVATAVGRRSPELLDQRRWTPGLLPEVVGRFGNGAASQSPTLPSGWASTERRSSCGSMQRTCQDDHSSADSKPRWVCARTACLEFGTDAWWRSVGCAHEPTWSFRRTRHLSRTTFGGG
jgi:transcriptional regulator with XRE-family HTH domain